MPPNDVQSKKEPDNHGRRAMPAIEFALNVRPHKSGMLTQVMIHE